MNYKHIIWDVDGTLLDTEYAVLHSLQDTVIRFLNKSVPVGDLLFALGIPGEVALERLGIADVEEANRYWNECMRKYDDHIRLFDGIRDLLEALAERGYALGIITSKTHSEFETDFVPHGISPCFGTVICMEDSPKPKPYPEPLLTYLQRNNLLPEEAIYIGDTEYDSQCAASAGVDFGLALWGCRTPSGISADYSFRTPEDVITYVCKP